MFERELAYFIKNQAELVAQHRGKTLVLRDQNVVGVYRDPLAAYLDAKARFDEGSYMIQPCEDGPNAYTVTLASHEVFG